MGTIGYLRQWGARVADATLAQYRPTRRLLLERRVAAAVAAKLGGRVERMPVVRLHLAETCRYGFDVLIHRDGREIVIELPLINAGSLWHKAAQLGPAYVYWLLACPPEVRTLSVTLSDGDRPGEHRFAPSTNQPHVTPIPDPYYFDTAGFSRWRRRAADQALPWRERSADIVWRGSSSGDGTFDPVLAAVQPRGAAPRMRLCLALRNVPGADAAISFIPREEVSLAVLVEHGVGAKPVAEETWMGRKFAIDIDGQTNTWSNLITRLHFGCCVLKIESERGFRQWYYDRLRPFEHYVPVRSDLSDLIEKIDWVRSHDAEAEAIARRGQELARSLDYPAVKAEAIALISERG